MQEQEMDAFLKEFGQTLKTTRKQMGLSQVTAAQNMKIDYRHYQNIEGGKINLRLDTMIKLVKFYNLSKEAGIFDLDAFLNLLSRSHGADAAHSIHGWTALYEHFVKGGHAGYLVLRCRGGTVMQINDRLLMALGLSAKSETVGRPLEVLLNGPEGVQKIDEICRAQRLNEVSHPFIVTFKAQAPAYLLQMMALATLIREPEDNEDFLHCMFFDRKTLDEEGHRLSEIVSGYKQFMELYPQLKAV